MPYPRAPKPERECNPPDVRSAERTPGAASRRSILPSPVREMSLRGILRAAAQSRSFLFSALARPPGSDNAESRLRNNSGNLGTRLHRPGLPYHNALGNSQPIRRRIFFPRDLRSRESDGESHRLRAPGRRLPEAPPPGLLCAAHRYHCGHIPGANKSARLSSPGAASTWLRTTSFWQTASPRHSSDDAAQPTMISRPNQPLHEIRALTDLYRPRLLIVCSI